MRLILIRHVETQANKEKKYIGITKSEYTKKGKKRINKIIDEVKDERVDLIYSSPMPRTLKIAQRVSKKLYKELKIEDSLIEMNFGLFENKTYKEVKRDHEVEWDQWIKDYKNYRIPEGESLKEVCERVSKFIDKLKESDNTYILVSHGGIIQSIVTYLLDLEIDDRWHFKIPPGAIVEIEYSEGYGVLNKLVY